MKNRLKTANPEKTATSDSRGNNFFERRKRLSDTHKIDLKIHQFSPNHNELNKTQGNFNISMGQGSLIQSPKRHSNFDGEDGIHSNNNKTAKNLMNTFYSNYSREMSDKNPNPLSQTKIIDLLNPQIDLLDDLDHYIKSEFDRQRSKKKQN